MVSSYGWADGRFESSVMAIHDPDEPVRAGLRMHTAGGLRLNAAGAVFASGEGTDFSPALLSGEGDRHYLDILSALVERSGLSMVGVDRQFQVAVANRRFCWQVGRSPTDLAGLRVDEVLDGGTSAYLCQRLSNSSLAGALGSLPLWSRGGLTARQ